MRLDDLVSEALSKIEGMTIKDFESECRKAGYTPVRKSESSMHVTRVVNATSALGKITYRHNVMLGGKETQSFGVDLLENRDYFA